MARSTTVKHRNLGIAFVLALGVAHAVPASAQTAQAYWAMDWEGSSPSQGIDTNPAYTTDPVSGTFDPRCSAAPCPLAGTLSARTGTGSSIMEKTDAEAGHTNVVHDFTWNFQGESWTTLV